MTEKMLDTRHPCYMILDQIAHYATHNGVDRKLRYNNISPGIFLDECCTYKISLPRQSGHTTNSLLIFPRYFDSILFVCANDFMITYCQNIVKTNVDDYLAKQIKFCSYNNLERSFEGSSFDCIIADNYSYVPPIKQKDLLYEAAIHVTTNPEKFCLFLIQ